jgi:hypothetical protein
MQVVEEIRGPLVAFIIYRLWFEQHFPGVDVRARSFANRFASTPPFIILKKATRRPALQFAASSRAASLGFWVI